VLHLLQSLSKYLLALLASSMCVVVSSTGLSMSWWAVQEALFPELKAQRKDGAMAKTLVWAVGDLGPVLALCRCVPCTKKWSGESKLLSSCHLS